VGKRAGVGVGIVAVGIGVVVDTAVGGVAVVEMVGMAVLGMVVDTVVVAERILVEVAVAVRRLVEVEMNSDIAVHEFVWDIMAAAALEVDTLD
jgi:hypothetical protein